MTARKFRSCGAFHEDSQAIQKPGGLRRPEARLLERNVFDSYIEGLQDVGWSGSQSDVRFGFAACTSMMFALGPWLDLMRDPKLDTIVQTTIGTGRDEFIDNLSILQSYFLDLGEEAVSLIGSKA